MAVILAYHVRMSSPLAAFAAATDRASEITWWNRGLSKLNRLPDVTNAESFVANKLVETKGPYVEFVSPPAMAAQSIAATLAEFDYDDRVIDAIVDELFDGDRTGSLYKHQVETITAIETDPYDNILAVPTAAGKTEAFFFPILNDCVTTDADGLKAIILYPMKTLGVDQLNRFIQYLDRVNRELPREDRVTIGIWDRDTPQAVGPRDFDIEIGANVRGLECPRTKQDLNVTSSGAPGSEKWTYPWIKITREQIRDGVDILLTNPEALDYMFVSNKEGTRTLLGEGPDKNPVQHLVFDEAHVWSGISGSSIGLLIRRLKHYYQAHNPQVTLGSATVENPAELASVLTGTPEDNVNVIGFTARDFAVSGTPDFDRFADCSLRDIVESLALVDHCELDVDAFCDEYPHLEGAVTTLQTVGLLTTTSPLTIDDVHRDWVTSAFEGVHGQAVSNDSESLPSLSSEVLDSLTEQVIEQGDLSGCWFDFVHEEVPEVAAMASWFADNSTAKVEFLHYTDLVDKVEDAGASNPKEAVGALLGLGRAAGLLTAKYHVFAKPPRKIYWCPICEEVTRCQTCPAGHQTQELRFCRTCHHPFVELADSDDTAFRPIGSDTAMSSCPGCNTTRLRLTDITVPTPTLLSFMLTELCRATPSEKTLVFSDSRSTAESVSNEIIWTEYGLTAETLYVRNLLENNGRASARSLFYAVSNTLREEYWQPLRQNTPGEKTDANDILVELLNDIEPHARLTHCQHLRETALVTPAWLYTLDDPIKAALGHTIFNLFISRYPPTFSRQTIDFSGYTRERLINKLDRDTRFDRSEIAAVVDEVLQGLLSQQVLEFKSWDQVRSTILDADVDEATEDVVFDYIEDQIETLEAIGGYGNVGGGIFVAHDPAVETDLQLVPSVTFCDECYTVSPVPASEVALDQCLQCGEPVDAYHRFRYEDDESITLLGWADIDTGWDYAVDHWGHDILAPLIPPDGTPVSKAEVLAQELEFITVGIHKGDVPPTLRSAIEEGFRKSVPDVNIVSATPTMELGVDIGTLDAVTQVGMAPTLTNYVQRSGRTGRTRGSAALVATTIRGMHPVDAHYYGDLDRFFDRFEPVRVPDPFDFDEVLAGHVVTEVMAYLARNPHPSGTFNYVYYVNQSVDSVAEFADAIKENLEKLHTFIADDVTQRLQAHLEQVFGEPGLALFEEIFFQDGPVSFEKRVEVACDRLRSFGEGIELASVRDGNNRLDAWLNRLGYLANYRDFGQQFPVHFEGSSEGISFQGEGRLYDFYPGEQNERGSVMTLYGSTYLVSDVEATHEPLQTVAVCMNEDCTRPFETYRDEAGYCPHCDSSLVVTPVHGVQTVSCRKAYPFEDQFSTSPIMSTHVQELTAETTAEETTIFGLSCDVTVGGYDVVDFIPVFERRHTMAADEEIKRSEARVTTGDGDTTPGEQYAPIGNQYMTQGLCLIFDKTAVGDRLPVDDPEQDEVWPQVFVSLEQALTKAIAVIAQSDQDDFRVKAMASGNEVRVYVVDNRQGGNGIAKQVQDALVAVEDEVQQVVDCGQCGAYCENCLLIERTPAAYLENNLLDRTVLQGAVTRTS